MYSTLLHLCRNAHASCQHLCQCTGWRLPSEIGAYILALQLEKSPYEHFAEVSCALPVDPLLCTASAIDVSNVAVEHVQRRSQLENLTSDDMQSVRRCPPVLASCRFM